MSRDIGTDASHVHCVELNVPPAQRPRKRASCIWPKPPEPIPEIVCEETVTDIINVTVKFRLSEAQIIARVYPNCMNMAELKQDIGRKFEVDPKLIVLKQNDRVLCDAVAIYNTLADDFGIHEIQLELDVGENANNPNPPKLDLNVYYDKYRLPDFITVYIAAEDTEDGQPKSIIVEIEDQSIEKPFLCGYKDKRTGKEFLNAFTQTGPYFDKRKYRRYRSRDTQTHEYKENTLNTGHEQTTQCFLDGNNVLYTSTATDYIIIPGKYTSHAQMVRAERKLEKILLIQRNWRRWILWKYIHKCAREYRRLVRNREDEEKRFRECVEERTERHARVKQFPRTKDDFDILISEVAKWKRAELKRIASMYDGPARIAEVNILLDKEIQLINGIERQQRLVYEAMEDFRKEKLLTELGKPITWIGYKDTKIHLDLLRTQRVRFLTEVYNDLCKPLPKEERLELLRKIMVIIMDEACYPDFPELFDLLDREKNLLLYAKSADVEILRKRQEILFYNLILFQKAEKQKRIPSRMCIVCKKVKPYAQFAIRTRQSHVDTCKHCYYLKSSSENTSYQSILRCIQRDERKRRCTTSFAFVLQQDDVRLIIDQIWHGHSILSKTEDISLLRLPRWNIADDWSPWNCVCLTEKEARDHYKIEDIEKVYDAKLILEVGNRHMLARSLFHTLAEVATEFQETGQWFKVGMNKQRSSNLNEK